MRQWDIYGQHRALTQVQLICHLPWDDILAAHNPTFSQKLLPPSYRGRGLDVEAGEVKNGCAEYTGMWGKAQEPMRVCTHPVDIRMPKGTWHYTANKITIRGEIVSNLMP